jgi:hypothetical protein
MIIGINNIHRELKCSDINILHHALWDLQCRDRQVLRCSVWGSQRVLVLDSSVMNEVRTTVKAFAVDSRKDGPSIDVALHCPWCGVVSRMSAKFLHQAMVSRTIQRYCVVICQARECNRAVFVVVDDTYGSLFDALEPFPGKVYPANQAQYAPDGVPAQIAKEFREALECAWSGHYLGAALVGRRVLQAAARNVIGGTRNDLKTEIAKIPDDRLNKPLKDQATHVRLIGNDAAHVDPIDSEDVNHLVDFVEQVLDALYVVPAKVAKLDAKRAALKAAKTAAAGSTAPTSPTAPAIATPPTK